MKPERNFFRDVTTGILFTTGLFGFVSGEFVISTLLFGAASLSSNLSLPADVKG
jgi:hypothetical protein